jgi:hypothetical protein
MASKQPYPAKVRTAEGPYTALPEPVRREDLIAVKQADPPPDPDAGRDPDRDFMLRYSG